MFWPLREFRPTAQLIRRTICSSVFPPSDLLPSTVVAVDKRLTTHPEIEAASEAASCNSCESYASIMTCALSERSGIPPIRSRCRDV